MIFYDDFPDVCKECDYLSCMSVYMDGRGEYTCRNPKCEHRIIHDTGVCGECIHACFEKTFLSLHWCMKYMRFMPKGQKECDRQDKGE